KVAALIICSLQDARASGYVHGGQYDFAASIDYTFLRGLDVVNGEVELPVWRNAFGHAGTATVHHSTGIEGLVGSEGLIDSHGAHVVRIVFLPAVMPGVIIEGSCRVIGEQLMPAHVAN